jgi:hypothetical protein
LRNEIRGRTKSDGGLELDVSPAPVSSILLE